MKKYLLLLLFSSFCIHTIAQTQFGNEWIVENQKYLKIKIAENGIYKIDYNQLVGKNFLNTNANPKNFQLFHNGVEIPIYIEGENNNTFENGDFIEFYGKKNDGKLDLPLYNSANMQPNSEVSLFDEHSYYYLTIGANNGKRYINTTVDASGLTAEAAIIYTSSANFAASYYPGSYLIDVLSLSEYIEGEGYMGELYGLGGTQSRTLNTPNVANTSFTPTLSYYVAGRSNAESTDANNHHLGVSIGSTLIADTKFKGYEVVRNTVNLTNSLLSENTTLNFSSINDLGAKTDYQAVSYARITYARNTDALAINSLRFKLATANPLVYLNFNNGNWTEGFLYDEVNQKRYLGIKSGNNTAFSINNPGDNHLQLVSTSGYRTPVTIDNVNFNIVKSSSYNAKLLIVTHKSLLSSANEYAAYKVTKGYSTNVLTTEDIYDQFYYGQHHPLAIKNLAKYLLLSNSTVEKPEYLLLLGKGYETPKYNLVNDLVPTMGYPASDSFLTSELIDNSMAPALATGRIPAKTNEEVLIYLNKLKKYDLQGNEIWRKNIINITGGSSSSEDASFSTYLKSLTSVAAKEYFGANAINYYKSVTDPVTDNLMAKISTNINEGVGILNFLGHGSTTTTAVSIGNPTYLNNSDKLLTYIVNGCSTGNAFVNGSLGENYIFQNDKGAIAWIGTSSEGIASYLFNFTNLLFRNSFETNYGSSIAQNIARSARSYQNSSDNYNRAHLRQYIFLGDPTVSFYSPTLPDYEIKNESIGLEDKNLTANSTVIRLFAIVKNIGKANANTIPIQVTRVLPNNTTFVYPIKSYDKVLNTDTLIIELDNALPNVNGYNKFIVKIDPNNQITELSKTNNSAEFSHIIQSNGIALISPNDFAIVSTAAVELKAQTNNLFAEEKSYSFEIDTVKTFNSVWKKSSPIINANTFVSWSPNQQLEDGKVYYWRAKQNTSDNSSNDQWETSSFTYINGSADGWNQSHHQQFSSATTKDIYFDNTVKNFEFTTTAYPVSIETKGINGPPAIERRLRVDVNRASVSFSSHDFEGFTIAAFATHTPSRINYPSPYNFKNDGVNGRGQYFFNTNIPDDIDALNYFLENVPNDYYVVGFSGVNFNPQTLPQTTKDYLTALGLSKFNTIGVGEPYAFWTQKGVLQKIQTLELTADYTSSTPANEQVISFSYDLPYPWGSGTVTSEKIGPANQWTEADFDFIQTANDEVQYSVIGVNNAGQDIPLKSNITSLPIDISDISANEYPYIKLSADIKDNVTKTIANFKAWKVLYTGYSDASFNTEIKNIFHAKEINQGDSLNVEIGVTNLEKATTSDILVKYKITKEDRSIVEGDIETIQPLATNANHITKFKYPTNELNGQTNLQLILAPQNKKDKLEFNNYAIYDVKVVKDVREPVIEVYFDNKRIINGDIVSPTPKINISVYDENKYLILTDTTHLELYLKEENEQNFRRIAFRNQNIQINQIGTNTNNKIDFLYSPEQLADGKYILKLRGKDASGNYNTNSDYLVNFEVINQQSITNFLPYPNPFTTKMKFVYQVTGKVPDKIKIQIMTVTGKIVREVFKEELGNINVGNNISDFTWDGTDQFGDRLANGIYFYNVIMENNDKSEIKHRSNSTDAYFKKNFGKIYLMR